MQQLVFLGICVSVTVTQSCNQPQNWNFLAWPTWYSWLCHVAHDMYNVYNFKEFHTDQVDTIDTIVFFKECQAAAI